MFRILAELKVDIMDADAGNLTIPVNESSALGSFVGSGRERKQEGDSEHRDDAEGAGEIFLSVKSLESQRAG
jgi:hypothetical protein